MTTGLCAGRVVLVTHAGPGLGRSHALDVAQHGAQVLVNGGHAAAIAEEIVALGGEAVACDEDPADWLGAARLVDLAVSTFGRLDVLVNQPLSRRPGRVAVARHAAAHWRARARAGEHVQGRIVNTSAEPAARAGIVGLTVVEAGELARYGVTVNAIVLAGGERRISTLPVPEAAVVWLGSIFSGHVTGRVFAVSRGTMEA
jgi:NAD(P)-dependent dehydrogenase (short-subunit alcohol dehydrogenase family)